MTRNGEDSSRSDTIVRYAARIAELLQRAEQAEADALNATNIANDAIRRLAQAEAEVDRLKVCGNCGHHREGPPCNLKKGDGLPWENTGRLC